MSATAIDTDAISGFLRALAPADLDGVPVYVVVPPPNRRDPGAQGWTYPGIDGDMRDVIGAGWKGRGPALALNLESIRCATLYEDDLPDFARAVAMHELAHVFALWGVDRFRTAQDVPPVMTPERLAFARSFASVRIIGPDALTPDWDEDRHGPQFIRVACHLLARAEALGVNRCDLFPRIVTTDHGRPRHVGATAYQRALGDELRTMAKAPFADIVNAPIPGALVDLWKSEFQPLSGA